MERIPVVIHGVQCGWVRFSREGAYMICRGQAKFSGEMLRLWVYGSGVPVYLGVLLPDERGMGRIYKKFSLGDFARLPKPVGYIGTEEAVQAPQPTDERDVIWYRMADGTLQRTENGCRYVAFPAEGVRLPRGGEFLLRTIEGRSYVVFYG